jgi:hypothetical protein
MGTKMTARPQFITHELAVAQMEEHLPSKCEPNFKTQYHQTPTQNKNMLINVSPMKWKRHTQIQREEMSGK